MGSRFACQASAAFGLEGLVAEELRSLNMADVLSENGDVRFSADAEELFRCNLFLRYCDRVFVVMADQKCVTFDELFRLVNSIPWEDYVSGNEAFNISAKCARSRLMSPRDCQSIAKKALLERLKEKTKLRIFPENGPSFPVLVSVHSDRVRILLNTSGDALSRRGYRTWNGEAPLRETLAAALVRLSPWKPGMPLYDPCCGTGTILTEAALIASHRCPGISRHFAMEQFHFCQSLDFTFFSLSLNFTCLFIKKCCLFVFAIFAKHIKSLLYIRLSIIVLNISARTTSRKSPLGIAASAFSDIIDA